jgi:hypothetical protein
MLCLQNEKIVGGESIEKKCIDIGRRRKSNRNQAVLYYDDDCVVISRWADYNRTLPSFMTLKGALEMTYLAMEGDVDFDDYGDEDCDKYILSDCDLYAVTSLPSARILTFENGANFTISRAAYDELKKEFGGRSEMTYYSIVKYIYDHFA